MVRGLGLVLLRVKFGFSNSQIFSLSVNNLDRIDAVAVLDLCLERYHVSAGLSSFPPTTTATIATREHGTTEELLDCGLRKEILSCI